MVVSTLALNTYRAQSVYARATTLVVTVVPATTAALFWVQRAKTLVGKFVSVTTAALVRVGWAKRLVVASPQATTATQKLSSGVSA